MHRDTLKLAYVSDQLFNNFSFERRLKGRGLARKAAGRMGLRKGRLPSQNLKHSAAPVFTELPNS